MDGTEPGNLHRLIYVSRSALPSGAAGQSALAALVRNGAKANADQGITSLLLAHKGWFVQALEGPTQAVLGAFLAIFEDRRHRDVRVIIAGPAAQREFGDWDLSLRHVDPQDAALLAALTLTEAYDLERLTCRSALQLLMAVRGDEPHEALRASV